MKKSNILILMLDQHHGFKELLITDLNPADFGWTPDYRQTASFTHPHDPYMACKKYRDLNTFEESQRFLRAE